MRDRILRAAGGCLLTVGMAATSHAQVVQLPTFRFFSVQTSVLVPDRGTVSLGGITRSRHHRLSRGVPGLGKMPGAGRLFGNRGIASGHSVSEASVTAAIIDHAEWDRAVLAEAERRAGAGGRAGGGMDPEVARRADFLARHVATHQGVSGLEESRGEPQAETPAERLSLDEIRRRNEQARAQRQADARRYWQRGLTAEQAGKTGAARIYYQMAARQAESPARERILAYLERFDTPAVADDNDAPAGTDVAADTGARRLQR